MNITTHTMQSCWPLPPELSKPLARASLSTVTPFRRASPYERQPDDARRPQICMGADGFHARKELLTQFFSGEGYSLALNVPFAGALTPMKLYQKEPRPRSIMIEVSPFDETTGTDFLVWYGAVPIS